MAVDEEIPIIGFGPTESILFAFEACPIVFPLPVAPPIINEPPWGFIPIKVALFVVFVKLIFWIVLFCTKVGAPGLQLILIPPIVAEVELFIKGEPPQLGAEPPIKFPFIMLATELEVVPGRKLIAVQLVLVVPVEVELS